jgi:hypothetical protein
MSPSPRGSPSTGTTTRALALGVAAVLACASSWGRAAVAATADEAADFARRVPAPRADAAACRGFAAELKTMVAVDGAIRARWDMSQLAGKTAATAPAFVAQTDVVDRGNTARLKERVLACGWPAADVHGAGAADDVWLIVQHADHDRAFQRAFLAHVQREVDAGRGSVTQLAYLSDRLDAADGRPQRWGTQLKQVGPCTFDFFPLDDRGQVEARRHALGWPSLAEYHQLVLDMTLPASCREGAKTPATSHDAAETH